MKTFIVFEINASNFHTFYNMCLCTPSLLLLLIKAKRTTYLERIIDAILYEILTVYNRNWREGFIVFLRSSQHLKLTALHEVTEITGRKYHSLTYDRTPSYLCFWLVKYVVPDKNEIWSCRTMEGAQVIDGVAFLKKKDFISTFSICDTSWSDIFLW